MTVDLASVADALDAFPDWDENMRAEVYHAIDVAPETPVSSWGEAEAYFKGEGHAAWERVRTFVLKYTDKLNWAMTLLEAAGYESAPTKEEILKALYRGARMIR